jgi:ribonuclease Z
LRAEFQGKTQQEIMEARKAAVNLNENYTKVVMAYSGDTGPMELTPIRGADVLIHEATFLSPDDRDGKTHSTAAEAMLTAMQAGAKSLVLFHVSGRYLNHTVEEAIRKVAKEVGFNMPLFLLLGNRLAEVTL